MKRALPFTPELAGLRGLAAILVFFYHYVIDMRPIPAGAGIGPRLLSQVATHDYLTVDVFFVLSGFLITSLLLADKGQPHFFHNFYWRRLLRIGPVFLVTVLILNHVYPGLGRYILLCFLFVSNFSDRFGLNFLSPIWTLSIEEQFYLLWPQVIHRCKESVIAWIAVGLIVVSTVLRMTGFFTHWAWLSSGFTYCRLDGFGFGILIACKYVSENQLTRRVRRVIEVLAWPSLLYLCVAAYLVMPMLPRSTVSLQYMLYISLSNFLMFRFVYGIAVRQRRVRFLASTPMVFIGSISYAFYMYHAFILQHFYIRWGAPDAMHGWAFFGRMLVLYAITIAASTVSLYVIEKPAQRLRRYILARPADVHESLAIQPTAEAGANRKLI